MILDMHVHLREELPDKEWMWKQCPGTELEGQTAEQALEKMDNCKPKINKALIFGLNSLASETPEAMKKDNDYILKVVETHPNRFVGAGVIDPSWGDKAIQELDGEYHP